MGLSPGQEKVSKLEQEFSPFVRPGSRQTQQESLLGSGCSLAFPRPGRLFVWSTVDHDLLQEISAHKEFSSLHSFVISRTLSLAAIKILQDIDQPIRVTWMREPPRLASGRSPNIVGHDNENNFSVTRSWPGSVCGSCIKSSA